MVIPRGKIPTPANFLEVVAKKIESTEASSAYFRLPRAKFRAADHWGSGFTLGRHVPGRLLSIRGSGSKKANTRE
jgi:hypothetical protein